MRFALILSLLVAIIAVVFAIYNPHQVEMRLMDYQLTTPLAVAMIVTLLAGVIVGILASVPSISRRGRDARRLQKRVDELEASGGTVVERKAVSAPREHRKVQSTDPATSNAAEASGAAETERLAAETQRMAAEAQRRAEEIERREAEGRS